MNKRSTIPAQVETNQCKCCDVMSRALWYAWPCTVDTQKVWLILGYLEFLAMYICSYM